MKTTAGRVTDDERQRALVMDRDRAKIERLGIPQAGKIGFDAQRAVLAAVRRGEPVERVREIVRAHFVRLSPLVLDGMLAAHLSGFRRTVGTTDGKQATLQLARGGPHAEAIQTLQRRLRLPADTLDAIQAKYEAKAVRVLEGTSQAVERQIQEALLKTTMAGEHVREGVKAVRDAFAAAGITPENSFTLENLFRTQTQLAYGAGRWQAGQDEAIQEILWGYRYVTVGDDRVRPEHKGLDGTTAPKDDPIWKRIWPPNGFSCRCSTIEIFSKRKTVHPPAVVEVAGKEYKPGPDKGFTFNAGEWFDARSAIPKQEGAVPKAATRREAEEAAQEFGLASEVSYRGMSVETANTLNQTVHEQLWQFPELRKQSDVLGSFADWDRLAGDAAYQKARDAGKTEQQARQARRGAEEAVQANVRDRPESVRKSYARSFGLSSGDREIRGIVINQEWESPGKRRELQAALDDAVRTNLHPPGTNTTKAAIDHEVGHKLADLLGLTSEGKITDRELAGYVAKHLADKPAVERGVSRNAMRSDAELVADAWAEYKNSSSPRPAAMWIGRLIERKGGA